MHVLIQGQRKMKTHISLMTSLVIILLALSHQANGSMQAVTQVGFSVVKTAEAGPTPEAALVASGDWFNLRRLAQNAVLIHHPKGNVMIDTGLGKNIDKQFAANSFVMRQLFAYDFLDPAIGQFERANYDISQIKRIIPTHLHWDHASGIVDFPLAQVWVQKEEYEEAKAGMAPAHLQSQIDDENIKWHFFKLYPQPYKSFANSLDLYGDGSIVLVDLKGHSAGQIGIFLTVSSGQQYFFVGDTTWTVKGVQDNASRSDLIKWLVNVNWDDDLNQQKISQLHALQKIQPELIIVPAHDELLMKKLPVFPDFKY